MSYILLYDYMKGEKMKKILVILTGIVFVVIGIFVTVRENAKIKRCSVETVGTVVEIKEEWSTDSEGENYLTYYPVIRYQAGDMTVTKQSTSSASNDSTLSVGGIVVTSHKSKYNVNDSITVFYNPDNIEEFMIKDEKKTNTILAIVFIGLGALATILGIIKSDY